jgi:very-short-patch-repair endonuclease
MNQGKRLSMHPNLVAFIDRFEANTQKNGSYRDTIGRAELLFLEKVWTPVFQNNYDGLTAEYPLKDAKGGDRFVDFTYRRGGVCLVIEIDGFTTHARNISPGDFDDHLKRQNELILAGWMVLRFSARQVEYQAVNCQKQLQQAIGHWWSLAHGGPNSTGNTEIWNLRKQNIVQLALRYDGLIRAKDVSRELNIPLRTAQTWLKRFMNENLLEPESHRFRVTVYRLKGGNYAQTS